MMKRSLRSLTQSVGWAFVCLTIIGTVCGIAAWPFDQHGTDINAYFILFVIFVCLVSLCVVGSLLYGIHTSNYRLFYPFIVWAALAALIDVTVAISFGVLMLLHQIPFDAVYVVPLCAGATTVWLTALVVVVRYRTLVMKERGVVLLRNEEECE